jgi:excisionase family DNA binding protein
LITQEAALYLGMSPKKLRRRVRLGKIRVIQDGNVWKFDMKELNAYVDRQKSTEYPTGAGTNGFDERDGYVN